MHFSSREVKFLGLTVIAVSRTARLSPLQVLGFVKAQLIPKIAYIHRNIKAHRQNRGGMVFEPYKYDTHRGTSSSLSKHTGLSTRLFRTRASVRGPRPSSMGGLGRIHLPSKNVFQAWNSTSVPQSRRYLNVGGSDVLFEKSFQQNDTLHASRGAFLK